MFLPLRGEERVRHRAADHQDVDAFEERLDDGDLVADLRTAEHGDVRLVGRAHDLAERRDLLLEEKPAPAVAKELRQPVHARVRAVHGAEGVVDVDVRQLGELTTERFVVLLFFRVEAEVLEQADVASAQVVDDLLGRVADAVFGQGHVLAEELGETRGGGLEAQPGIGPLLRPAEVARADEPRARARARA